MGYYTHFHITFAHPDTGRDVDVLEWDAMQELGDQDLSESTDEDLLALGLELDAHTLPILRTMLDVSNEFSYMSGGESSKWYSWEQDMRKVSAAHPEVLFGMSGEGEDSGDQWKAYFLGGKCQRIGAEITFDPFDPAKLA